MKSTMLFNGDVDHDLKMVMLRLIARINWRLWDMVLWSCNCMHRVEHRSILPSVTLKDTALESMFALKYKGPGFAWAPLPRSRVSKAGEEGIILICLKNSGSSLPDIKFGLQSLGMSKVGVWPPTSITNTSKVLAYYIRLDFYHRVFYFQINFWISF